MKAGMVVTLCAHKCIVRSAMWGWADDWPEHVTNFGVQRCHRLNGFVLFYNTLYFNIPSRPNTSITTRTASTHVCQIINQI